MKKCYLELTWCPLYCVFHEPITERGNFLRKDDSGGRTLLIYFVLFIYVFRQGVKRRSLLGNSVDNFLVSVLAVCGVCGNREREAQHTPYRAENQEIRVLQFSNSIFFLKCIFKM